MGGEREIVGALCTGQCQCRHAGGSVYIESLSAAEEAKVCIGARARVYNRVNRADGAVIINVSFMQYNTRC